MFSGQFLGYLEVIWRSFSGSKLKSDKCNRLSVPKPPTNRHITYPEGDLVKVTFQITVGHLRSFRGRLEIIWRSLGCSKHKSNERN